MTLWLIALHMMGDFVFQTDWMAKNKHERPLALMSHCTLYTMMFIPLFIVYAPGPQDAVLATFLLFHMHLITDSRRWASGEHWPAKPILVDQSLHAFQLAVIATLFLEPTP